MAVRLRAQHRARAFPDGAAHGDGPRGKRGARGGLPQAPCNKGRSKDRPLCGRCVHAAPARAEDYFLVAVLVVVSPAGVVLALPPEAAVLPLCAALPESF